MGYICGKNITIYNEGNNNIWGLFHRHGTHGATIVKDRIYDAVQTTITFGYKVNHKFYRSYKFVDEICIAEAGIFYIIDLRNTFTQQVENIILPSCIFNNDMPTEKLHCFVKQWLEYLKTWHIEGGIYGKLPND